MHGRSGDVNAPVKRFLHGKPRNPLGYLTGNCILFRVEMFFTHPPKNFFFSEFERIALKLAAFFSFPALGRG